MPKYNVSKLREAVKQTEETRKQEAMKIMKVVGSAEVAEIGRGSISSSKENVTLPSGITVEKWSGYVGSYDLDGFGVIITSKSGETLFNAVLFTAWPTDPEIRTLKTGDWPENFEHEYRAVRRVALRSLHREEKLEEQKDLLEKAKTLGIDPELFIVKRPSKK